VPLRRTLSASSTLAGHSIKCVLPADCTPTLPVPLEINPGIVDASAEAHSPVAVVDHVKPWEGAPVKIDANLVGVPLHAVPARTAALLDAGVDGVFAAEGPNDVFFPLALAASVQRRVDLMTNAAVAFPRNPIHLAHSAWDLQDFSGGRFRLGLATQVRTHIERRFGVEWSTPVARMRELVGALRAIFATFQEGGALQFDGKFYRHRLMTPMFSPGPLSSGAPPILLGALGPQMTAMAAEVADGVLVLPFHGRRFLEGVTIPAINSGLEAANRTRADIEVVCGAIVGVGGDEEERQSALDGVRGLLGFYGSTPAYRRVLDAEGWGDRQPVLQRAVRSGAWSELGELVTDDMVSALAVTGSPSACAQQLVERLGGLADRVALFLPFQCSEETLTQLVAELRAASA